MLKIQEYLAYNMKLYRKKNNLTQQKLAELCDTTTNYIGAIEICKKFPSADMLQEIANALKIKPYQLFIDIEKDKVLENDIIKEKMKYIKNKTVKELKEVIDKNIKLI